MNTSWKIGAQLSTTHSRHLSENRLLEVVRRTTFVLDIDIMIVGSKEDPGVFDLMTQSRRSAKEVYLWYNLLSDIQGLAESDLVVTWRGERSRGWGGWKDGNAEVDETFRFVCPNNPGTREKTLDRLLELLNRYAFDGVFLDKFRFPSPANGLDEVLSCFCAHCRRSAAAIGLDLDAVARHLRSLAEGSSSLEVRDAESNEAWLDALVSSSELLSRFLKFRRDSITALVDEAHQRVSKLGRKISLDLFSPVLSGVVGQDYRALSKYCAWAKPMTYRVAKGPAGLRLEIPALAEGIARTFGVGEASMSKWAARHLKGFSEGTLQVTRDSAVPLSVMSAEVNEAVNLMHPVPVYFGLELVRHPGVIDITAEQVVEMVKIGREASAAGTIISWDLMHAPHDLVETLASVI